MRQSNPGGASLRCGRSTRGRARGPEGATDPGRGACGGARNGEQGGMHCHSHAPGLHLLLDLWGCRGLDDAAGLETLLRAAAEAAGARVLGAGFHPFAGGGVTGVVLLAESHITVHTWPEHGFAAFDIFMCGAAEPARAQAVILQRLAPARSRVTAVPRGHDHLNQVSQPAL